jgi:hypothetical protein
MRALRTCETVPKSPGFLTLPSHRSGNWRRKSVLLPGMLRLGVTQRPQVMATSTPTAENRRSRNDGSIHEWSRNTGTQQQLPEVTRNNHACHMRGSVQKQSRRAVPPKTFFKSICFEILSATWGSYNSSTPAGPLSWSHPPAKSTSSQRVLKNIGSTAETAGRRRYIRPRVWAEVSQTSCKNGYLRIEKNP